MIHMSQVKVPVKELVKKVEPELFCKGKIGKAEDVLRRSGFVAINPL